MYGRFLWVVLLLCAVGELAAHAAIRSRIPSDADYHAAGERLRQEFHPQDAIASAPDYIDPLLRREVGDQMPLSLVGRPDLSAYRRLWVLSLGGAHPQDAPDHAPEWQEAFGHLHLARYALPEPTMQLNLVDQLEKAVVQLTVRNRTRDCRLRRGRPERGGALGLGTIGAPSRFVCGPGRDQMVAAVVVEDLDLAPRYCVWQPALTGRTLKVRYTNIILHDELVIDAGLYYEHERDETGPPVTLTVRIDGQEQGKLVHKDGQGFRRLVVATKHMIAKTLEIEVHSNRTRNPGFCWSGSVRKAEP